MFFFGRQKKCVSDVRDQRWWCFCGLASRSLGEGWKNVYFCFGNFIKHIKALPEIRVYFCIPFTFGWERLCFESTG